MTKLHKTVGIAIGCGDPSPARMRVRESTAAGPPDVPPWQSERGPRSIMRADVRLHGRHSRAGTSHRTSASSASKWFGHQVLQPVGTRSPRCMRFFNDCMPPRTTCSSFSSRVHVVATQATRSSTATVVRRLIVGCATRESAGDSHHPCSGALKLRPNRS